jgi:hypothetical protein
MNTAPVSSLWYVVVTSFVAARSGAPGRSDRMSVAMTIAESILFFASEMFIFDFARRFFFVALPPFVAWGGHALWLFLPAHKKRLLRYAGFAFLGTSERV